VLLAAEADGGEHVSTNALTGPVAWNLLVGVYAMPRQRDMLFT
jgi:hypothetical protein